MKRSLAIVGGLTALAAALRFPGIGHQSYWYDEAHTVWLVHASLGRMLARVQTSETSPPCYFIVAWLWAHVFGYGEAGLRSLSAVAGVVTVPVAYAAATKLLSRRAGLISAALVACSPLLVWYSQEARAYAVLVLLTTVAWLALAHVRTQPTRTWVIVWAVACGLALATHYYAALVVVPQAIWLFARHRRNRVVRFGVEAVVVWSLLLSVLAVKQLLFLGSGSNWINQVPLLRRVRDVPSAFASGPGAPLSPWLTLTSLIGVGIAVWVLIRRADSGERLAMRFLARLAAGGFGLVIALIVAGFDQLDYRNLIALWLPLAVLTAGGLGVRRARAAGLAGAVLLCGAGIATVIGVGIDGRLQRPDWRAVARTLGARPSRAIFAVNGCQLLPLSLYVPGLQFAPAGGAVMQEVDVISAADQTSWYQVLFSGAYVTCRPQAPKAIPRQLGSFRALRDPVRIGAFSVLRLRSRVPLRVTQRMFSGAGLRGALMVQEPGSAQAAAGYSAP